VFALSRRSFLKLSIGGILSGAVFSLLGGLYALRIEPRWVEVTRPRIALRRLPKALEGFTIAHLSDIHLGPYVRPQDVRMAVWMVNALKPDLIVLTGDFVYHSARYSAACAKELASLSAPCGVYAVLGNHDVWTDAGKVVRDLREAGVRVLRNEREAVEIGDARLWLLGIEDTGYTGFLGGFFSDFQAMWQKAAQALAGLLDEIPPDEPRILLVHNPDFTEMLPDEQIDLALCGHTHGGQVRLPFIGAPVLPSCFGQKYAAGLVSNEHTLVYVNRGLGLIYPPIRFNCRPEITLIQLKSFLTPSVDLTNPVLPL